MSSFGFVVLHYKLYEETRETIDSILALPRDGRKVEIVVVDNASDNGSTEKIRADYDGVDEVSIICNKENLGFSKGNNVGFAELKRKGYDFIILSNNDIKVLSKDFYFKVEEDYKKYRFGVLGTGIKNPNNGRTGCGLNPPTIRFAKGRIFRLRFKYYAGPIYNLYRKIINKNTAIENAGYGETVTCKWKNVLLHGCFMIFSKEYIERFDGLKELTFMYAEEEILFIRIMSAGLISIYDPDIEIFHAEGAATASVEKKLTKLGYDRHLAAQKALIKELKEHPELQNVRSEKL